MRALLPGCSSARDKSNANKVYVYLNIYDLTPVNNYLYWFGLGIFHSGIEVHGKEYGFGAHEYASSGVFEVEPKSCPGFIYRRSVCLGTTDMSHTEFRLFIEHLSGKYHGDTYHLIAKNCNHFTDDVCLRLTGKPIPGWVNRLAKLGSFCNCLLPETVQVAPIRIPEHPEYSGGSLQRVAEGSGFKTFLQEVQAPDGSESFASSAMGESDDDEESDQQPLTAPSSDKPLRLARDVM